MQRLTHDGIVAALRALATEIGDSGTPLELIVVGGAALVLMYGARDTTRDVDAFPTDATNAPRTLAVEQLLAMKLCAWRDDLDVGDARLLLSRMRGDRHAVWQAVAPYLLPGRELKASYAFADLWEADRGA